MSARSVELRAEHSGPDYRFLRARLNEAGDLLLEGQDLGPATRIVSDDGEYAWVRTIHAQHLPALRTLLSITASEELLDALAASWSGPRSYDLEAVLRDSAIPTELFTWF